MDALNTETKSPVKSRSGGAYTRETRRWLNRRFDLYDSAGFYIPNQASYGFSAAAFRLEEYARMYAILHCLDRMCFGSILDTGCADGFGSALAGSLFNARVTGMDLSDRAVVRGREMYHLTGCCGDTHALPFPDSSFDVVICSEVLEHVTDPGRAIAEMIRVGRRFVILTTPRAPGIDAEKSHGDTIDPGEPHAHIHYFSTQTLRRLIGRPAFFKGARTRLMARILDALAWDGADGMVQRRSYLDFTLATTHLNPANRDAMEHALIGRYSSPPPRYKKALGRPLTVGALLRLDVLLASRFPGLAADHLVVIPLSSEPLRKQPSVGDRKILSALLGGFRVAPLRRRRS